jgi:hypothetical protein
MGIFIISPSVKVKEKAEPAARKKCAARNRPPSIPDNHPAASDAGNRTYIPIPQAIPFIGAILK